MTKQETICDFCGKTNMEVAVIIAGINVYICNECVELAYAICQERMAGDKEYDSWFSK